MFWSTWYIKFHEFLPQSRFELTSTISGDYWEHSTMWDPSANKGSGNCRLSSIMDRKSFKPRSKLINNSNEVSIAFGWWWRSKIEVHLLKSIIRGSKSWDWGDGVMMYLHLWHQIQDLAHFHASELMFGQANWEVMSCWVALTSGYKSECKESKNCCPYDDGMIGQGTPIDISQIILPLVKDKPSEVVMTKTSAVKLQPSV